MQNIEAQQTISLLAQLMRERTEKAVADDKPTELYNNIRELIHGRLVSSLEGVSWAHKYDVVDRANQLADTMGVCIVQPELMAKNRVGLWKLSPRDLEILLGTNASTAASGSVPTVVVNGKDTDHVQVVNSSGNRISAKRNDYAALDNADSASLDLSAVVSSVSMSMPHINETLAAIVFPDRLSGLRGHTHALFGMLDAVVVHSSALDEELAKAVSDAGVQSIIIVNDTDTTQHDTSNSTAAYPLTDASIGVTAVNTMEEARMALGATLQHPVDPALTIQMERAFADVLWNLADQMEQLNQLLEQTNRDLAGSTHGKETAYIKKLRKSVVQRIRQLEHTANTYYATMEKIVRSTEELVRLMERDASADSAARAANDDLLDIIVAETAFFRVFPRSNANDHIRLVEGKIAATENEAAVLRAILSDYHGHPPAQGDLAVLALFKARGPLLARKILRMHLTLKLPASQLADLLDTLGDQLYPSELRTRGMMRCTLGDKPTGKQDLRAAMTAGDRKAGEFLFFVEKNEQLSEDRLVLMADSGVAAAAFILGQTYYQRKKYEQAFRYLHIAASQGHDEAIRLLGDMWYDRAMSSGSRQSNEKLKRALHYYSKYMGESDPDADLAEHMGIAMYTLNDYRNAYGMLKKARSAEAEYLMGKMHEKGEGRPKSLEKSQKHYEKAMREGHSRAEKAYSRVSRQIEEKEQREAAKKTDYSSSTTYSGGYSSGGWF